MTGRYATKTRVPVAESRKQIEETIRRYGADQFLFGEDTIAGSAAIQFRMNERYVKFAITLPTEDEFRLTESTGKERTDTSRKQAHNQACRQMWRALYLCIKAKLEAVESGISVFDDEFMAHVILPSGETVGEMMRPQIANSYLSGVKPAGIAGLLEAPKGQP